MSGTDYTLTTNYGLYKPLPNADINQWGSHLNLNADKLDTLLGPGGAAPFLPLAGGTVSGPTFINSNLILTPPTFTLSGTNTGYQCPVFMQTSVAGSFSDGRSFTLFNLAGDNAAATGTNSANGFSFLLNYGGNAMKGGRIGLNAELIQSAATQNIAAFYQAVNFAASASQPELNGTTPTMTGGSSVFSIGSYATLQPTALGYSALHGYEQDMIVGAQPYSVNGISVVRLSGGLSTLYQAVEPSLDIGIAVASVLNAANSNWIQGYAIGSPNSAWPIDPIRGTLFKAFPGQGYTVNPPKALAGIDLSYVQFGGNAWHSQGALVDGSGHATFNQLNLGNWSAAFNANGLNLDAATRQIALSAAVAAGGSGYNINEQFGFAGNGRGIVTAQGGGAVTGFAILEYPTATTPPTNPVATTSLMFPNAGQAHGTGLTLTLTWSVANSLALNPSGGGTTLGGPTTYLTVFSSGGNMFVEGIGGGLILDAVGTLAVGWSSNPAITISGSSIKLASNVGFNNTTPIAKPTVTGAKGSNAALASLMTALAAYGLVTDTTTA